MIDEAQHIHNLRNFAKSQKDNAQNDINRLRGRIIELERDIKYSEGERDGAEMMLMQIDMFEKPEVETEG